MAVNKNDKVLATAMLEQISDEWFVRMPCNMLSYFSAQMVVDVGCARTVNYLRDMADAIEGAGMRLDGRKTWK
jgi:hypothetical protein